MKRETPTFTGAVEGLIILWGLGLTVVGFILAVRWAFTVHF